VTAGTRAIDAALFDFGGVIVDSPFDAFTALEQRSGAVAGAVREINSRNPDANAWAQIERGEIDIDEFARLFEAEAAEVGHRLPGREMIEIVRTLSSSSRAQARPTMVAALQRCRDLGVRLALITNNIQPLSENPGSAWLSEYFEVIIESCVTGVRKPERKIYELALSGLGVAPERAVMLDDLGINLKPARAMGMATIKVADPAPAIAELDALLG
jgi:putative hydrolase of the HAD superfamily